LVCGCLSLLCGIFASIPAIILGHMGLSEIKKNPTIQGRGMALAGVIMGYAISAIAIVYVCIVGLSVLIALGNQVKPAKTIYGPLKSQTTNSADQAATNSGPITNAPPQSAPAPATTNSTDQSTNSASATTNSPDQSTNSAASSTNSSTPSTNAAPTNP
jgi:peptidyl-prolyl cis-trans isomerase B (cyclophilin B)